MKAVRLSEYGQPEVLQYIEVPVPEIEPDEVLVRVRGTSVTRWDLRYRQGLLTPPPGRAALPLPFQLGRDTAGEVQAVGAEVRRFKTGDRVVAMTCPACGGCEYCKRGLDNLCTDIALPGHQRFGAYAQYVCRKETELLHAPDSLSFEKLACLLWSYSTVWHMAIERGRLRPGQDVLVTAASGGMGTAAIQIAKLAGAARIVALTGSANKVAPLQKLGASHVLNYREENVPARIAEITNGLGVDLALENVGGEMLPLCMQCLRMDGTLVSAGQHGGRHARGRGGTARLHRRQHRRRVHNRRDRRGPRRPRHHVHDDAGARAQLRGVHARRRGDRASPRLLAGSILSRDPWRPRQLIRRRCPIPRGLPTRPGYCCRSRESRCPHGECGP